MIWYKILRQLKQGFIKTDLLLLQLHIKKYNLSKLEHFGHIRNKLHRDLILWKHDLEI